MATAEQIGIRREAAMGRLTADTKKLSKHLGVEFDEFPAARRDPLQTQVEQVEWTADTLSSIEKRAERLSDANAIEAELATITAERDSAIEAATAVKEADEQDAAIRAAMQRLVGLAASDVWVRRALADAGFIQAKESEDGVSVSVVGLGPDMDVTPQPAVDSELPTPEELAARMAEASEAGAKAEDVSAKQADAEQKAAEAKALADMKAKAEAEAKAKKGSA